MASGSSEKGAVSSDSMASANAFSLAAFSHAASRSRACGSATVAAQAQTHTHSQRQRATQALPSPKATINGCCFQKRNQLRSLYRQLERGSRTHPPVLGLELADVAEVLERGLVLAEREVARRAPVEGLSVRPVKLQRQLLRQRAREAFGAAGCGRGVAAARVIGVVVGYGAKWSRWVQGERHECSDTSATPERQPLSSYSTLPHTPLECAPTASAMARP